jgi:PAS domain-containing protein
MKHTQNTKKNRRDSTAGTAKRTSKARAEETHQTLQERLGQEQNDFLANIIEFLPYPFYVIDAHDYKIRLANSAAGSLKAAKDSPCYIVTHRRAAPCAKSGCLCPLDEVKKTRKSVVMEHVHYGKDGKAKHVEVHGHPILDADGNVVQMIEYCLDITERKRAEQERLQKEKLQGVLETAGAACHELNQPIQALYAYVHSILKRLSKNDSFYEDIEAINRETKRIAEITHKLKNITRYESRHYFRNTKIIDIDKSSK